MIFRFKTIFSFFILLTQVSCRQADMDIARPDNILSDSVFEAILLDFSIAEGASSINVSHAANNKYDSAYAFNPLKQRGIRQSQYDSTLAYFARHIPEYKHIYEGVLDRLGALQAESQALSADSVHR
ncbi:MAG TPA: DUF4296 domain-containing protein [Bacteroidia bacterium]|nr:DUF4296 domain-containing protein [Bacteroidia bacterium]